MWQAPEIIGGLSAGRLTPPVDVYAFAIGNLSRDDIQHEPGHGGVALIFGLRIRGVTDHAGRRDPPFSHAVAVVDRALDAEAIERAKTRLVAETVYAADSQSSLARIYGSALAIGENLEAVRRWPAEIEAVMRDDLASAAERFLQPRRSVTGHLSKADAPSS